MIKVADFGLTEDMYGNNYFRQGKSETGSDEKLPIKWVAPESIENDVYTEATDVVSTDIAAASICYVLCVVVIWSDSVGDLHLWEDPILPIMRLLKELQRLERPENEACSDEM